MDMIVSSGNRVMPPPVGGFVDAAVATEQEGARELDLLRFATLR